MNYYPFDCCLTKLNDCFCTKFQIFIITAWK